MVVYAEMDCGNKTDVLRENTQRLFRKEWIKLWINIVGQTAAEIIYTKADREKEHMGLITWKNAPDGRIVKKMLEKGGE